MRCLTGFSINLCIKLADSHQKKECEMLFYDEYCYNPDHNILELYNILAQAWLATSKTKLDI